MRARLAPALALLLLGLNNPCATTSPEDQNTGRVGARPETAEAAAPSRGAPPERPPGEWTDCSERYPERPQACTREYRPVCGVRDTGVRCVKAPCPDSVEWKTYGNGCDACADAAVSGYADGACEDGE